MTWQAHNNSVNQLKLLSDGSLITASSDMTLAVWDFYSRNLISTFTSHTGAVNAFDILSSGLVVSGGADKKIFIWNRTTGVQVAAKNFAHTAAILCITTLPGGMFATGSASPDNSIKIWSASSITSPVYTLTGHTSDVNVMTYSPRGYLISGSSDGKAIFWNTGGSQAASFKPLGLQKVYGVVELDDGSFAFCGNTDLVNIWVLTLAILPLQTSSLSVLFGEQPCNSFLSYNSSLLLVASSSISTELIDVGDSTNPFRIKNLSLNISMTLTLDNQSKY